MADIVADLLAIAGSPDHPYAQPAAAEISLLRARIGALLTATTTEQRACRLCGAKIAVVRATGRAAACFDLDGCDHAGTCGEAHRIRRRADENAGPRSLFATMEASEPIAPVAEERRHG